MDTFKPDKYTAVQSMLKDLGFVYYEAEEHFGKGEVKFPAVAISGHSPSSFYAEMGTKGWLKTGEPETYFEGMRRLFSGMDFTAGIGQSLFTLDFAREDKGRKWLMNCLLPCTVRGGEEE